MLDFAGAAGGIILCAGRGPAMAHDS